MEWENWTVVVGPNQSLLHVCRSEVHLPSHSITAGEKLFFSPTLD